MRQRHRINERHQHHDVFERGHRSPRSESNLADGWAEPQASAIAVSYSSCSLSQRASMSASFFAESARFLETALPRAGSFANKSGSDSDLSHLAISRFSSEIWCSAASSLSLS